MLFAFHKHATTTKKNRAALQASTDPAWMIAKHGWTRGKHARPRRTIAVVHGGQARVVRADDTCLRESDAGLKDKFDASIQSMADEGSPRRRATRHSAGRRTGPDCKSAAGRTLSLQSLFCTRGQIWQVS